MSKHSKPQSIEDYLQAVARELRALPADARDEELREIEAHLNALVLAGQQLEEVSESEATATALKQFGAPRKVGRNLRRAWERGQPEAWWRLVLAPIVGMALQTTLGLLIATAIMVGSYFSLDTKIEGILPASVIGDFYVALIFSCYAVSTIITGFGIGAVSPKRGKWVVAFYFLLTTAMLSSQLFRRGFIDFDDSMSLLLTSFWSIGGAFFLSCLILLYGNYLGARHGRRLLARIANAK